MRYKSFAFAVPMLLMLSAAIAGGVYRWTDAQGVIHYSDSPPPHAQQTKIESSRTDPAAVAAREKALNKTLQTYDKQQQKADDAAEKAAAKQKIAKANCARAKARSHMLESVNHVQTVDQNGKTTWLSGDKLVQYRHDAQQKISQYCAGD